MALRPKYKNEVTMTFRISNDFGERKAIRQVSDKMIVIQAYKTCGYDSTHHKNPTINAEIVIFTGDANVVTETEFTKENFPKPGDFIDVTGSFTTTSHTGKDGKVYTGFKINASKVVFSEMEEVEDVSYEDSAAIWGDK